MTQDVDEILCDSIQTIKTFRTYNNIEAFVNQRPHQENKMVTYNPHLSRPAIPTPSNAKPKTAEPQPGG